MSNHLLAARMKLSRPRSIIALAGARQRIVWGLVLILAGSLGVGRSWSAEPGFEIVDRVPWTTSTFVGSPEPPLEFTVERVFENVPLTNPIYLVAEPGSAHWLAVLASTSAQTASRIVRFADDPAARECDTYFELPGRLLYSLVFHPEFAENGFVYLFSNGPLEAPERVNRVSRFSVLRNEHQIDAASEQVLLEWRSMGHDGGDMLFGPDGLLYITTGDGTSDSDPWNAGQSLDDLLGSVLRIDVDRASAALPYTIPADNPFVETPGARGEIWAYGLRNPWRMSYDAESRQLWVGNNGQDLWETAHLVHRGDNFGWSVLEGSHPFYLQRRRGPTPLVPPTIEHHHCDFRSLTGGVVYRGEQFPELVGAYIYGDYASGRIWGMQHNGRQPLWQRELADTQLAIAAFRNSPRGDLLIVDHGGGIYRLARAKQEERRGPFPRRLSETGLFAATAAHRLAPGVIPYEVNAPGWNDGAQAERCIAIPGTGQVDFVSGPSWNLPDGAVLLQTLSLNLAAKNAAAADIARPRRIETRVLLRQQGEWAGYSYRWNETQDDAELVERSGAEAVFEVVAGDSPVPQQQRWHFPSRSECLACHSRAANFVLGLTEAQLNRDFEYAAGPENQLTAFERIGLFSAKLPKPAAELAKLVDPHDPSRPLDDRARSYLHVQCSVCHVANGGGNSLLELAVGTHRDQMRLLDARPQHDTFGLENAMLVAPGDPERSVLLQRLGRRGPGQMPPLVSRVVDHEAVELLRQWIEQLPPRRAFVRHWTLDDMEALLADAAINDAQQQGETLYREIGCADCHRRGAAGGTVGPDLSTIGRRLSRRELLESMLAPSLKIAEEYAITLIATDAGHIHAGRIEREDNQVLVLRPSAAGEQPVEIPVASIIERHQSDRSSMPTGTLDVLPADEIRALLAYLQSDAKSADPRFE